MFEGQRLSYIVPGYTGYLYHHSAISQKKFTMSSKESTSKNLSPRYQDTPDTCLQLSLKTCMEILLERLLWTLELAAL